MSEIREELRLIRQAVARTMDMLAEMAAARMTVSLTEKGEKALADSRPVAPLVAHVHEVKAEPKPLAKAEAEAEQPKPEQAEKPQPEQSEKPEPQPVAEQEKAEAQSVPTDLPGMRQALAAIVGGPTFTPKQKEDLKAIFMRYGCTLLKEIPAEAYGDVLASFRKAVEVK